MHTFKELLRRVLWVVLVLAMPSFVFAQTNQTPNTQEAPPLVPSNNGFPEGMSSCFDYYQFGSAPTVITSQTTNIAEGGQITFTGTVTNNNPYPLVGIAVYDKVFRRVNPGVKSSFGPDVVDWGVVVSDLTLKAGESKPFSYTWQVPKDIEPGQYSFATFVAEQDRFNLSGLSFTNDIISGSYTFNILGTDLGAVRFNLQGTMIEGQVFHAAAYSPQIPHVKGNDVSVTAVINNSTSNSFRGTIDWKMYSWDALAASHLLDEKTQDVKMLPNSTTTVEYAGKDLNHSVYFLVATLQSDEPNAAKSVLDVRYVDTDVNEPRLAFVGPTTYPVKSGTNFFACVHNTGRSDANNSQVQLTVQSLDTIAHLWGGGIIAQDTYTGTIPGTIGAIVASSSASANSFIVTAKLYQNGKQIDSVSIPYTCSDLGTPCSHQTLYTLIIIGVALVLLTILFGLMRRRFPTEPPFSSNPQSNQL